MRALRTTINVIAAMIALAVIVWASQAWAQNQSKRAEHGSEAQLGTLGTPNTVADKLPNVDRLSRRGVIFTDWYSRQSCTSGRAAFETGRYPARAGLTKVGPSGTE